MVKQIGVCYIICSRTGIAVIDLQDGISRKMLTIWTPYSEIVDADGIGLKDSTITHIDNPPAFTTAIEHQRRCIGITSVIQAAAGTQRHLFLDIQIGGILQRKVITHDFRKPGTATIDKHAFTTLIVGKTAY